MIQRLNLGTTPLPNTEQFSALVRGYDRLQRYVGWSHLFRNCS